MTDTFSFEVVAVLVARLLANGVTVSRKEFELMAQLDSGGTKGQSSYEHQFRRVKARAKEIHDGGSGGTPKGKGAIAGKAKGKGEPKGEPKRVKRGRKTKGDTPQQDDDDDENPVKKVKGEVKEEVLEDADPALLNEGLELANDFE